MAQAAAAAAAAAGPLAQRADHLSVMVSVVPLLLAPWLRVDP